MECPTAPVRPSCREAAIAAPRKGTISNKCHHRRVSQDWIGTSAMKLSRSQPSATSLAGIAWARIDERQKRRWSWQENSRAARCEPFSSRPRLVPEKRRRELNREWEHYHSTPEACELGA